MSLQIQPKATLNINFVQNPFINAEALLYSSRFAQTTSSSNGATARNNNQPVSTTATTSTSGTSARAAQNRQRGRVVRAMARGRGSGVIVGSRSLLPTSVVHVPEELINQVSSGVHYTVFFCFISDRLPVLAFALL